MPLEVAPVATPVKPETEEIRLALVCYGGVSLAIWMHGVTKELQKLVEASEAYDDPERGRPSDPVQAAYYDLLERLESTSKKRTRVVIDIVAGTSAGGINGIVLAKALARGLDQAPVTKVWLDAGDLKQLMRSAPLRMMPGPVGKALAWLGASLVGGFRPPLRGDLLLKLVHDALETMDGERPQARPVSPNNPVELHVTMTDFQGYDHAVPADWPLSITDRRYRHVLSFAASKDQLERSHNGRLAFAARATSSFPGAFEPVNLSDMARVLSLAPDDVNTFANEQWSIYRLSGADVNKTQMVDGGVLDNAPFKLAIAAIQGKPAATEVRRRLVFIQPDPPLPGGATEGEHAGLFETVWGSTGRLPRHEPMLDDLLELQAFNERVDRVASIVSAGTAIATPGNGDASEAAMAQAGFAYASYVELKLHGVVERLASFAAELCRFPPESRQARFVRAVMLRWARNDKLIGTGQPIARSQIDFLKAFDLEYGERRLRYVIKQLNATYRDAPPPPRDEINQLKADLYELIKALWEPVANVDPKPVRDLFAEDRIAQALAQSEDWNQAVADFTGEFHDDIVGVRDGVQATIGPPLADFGADARTRLETAVAGWPTATKTALIEAFDRFPFWDVLLYPIRKASETAELDNVKVRRLSPREVGLLSDEGPKKLEGTKFGHFGAFFTRKARENDYLWGRLDAAEWIVHLLCGEPDRERCADAFSAILAAESGLSEVEDLREDLARRVAELRT